MSCEAQNHQHCHRDVAWLVGISIECVGAAVVMCVAGGGGGVAGRLVAWAVWRECSCMSPAFVILLLTLLYLLLRKYCFVGTLL